MKTIEIEFNKDFLEFKKGQKRTIQCDDEKTPLELRFRKLLKDSETDKTVSVVEEKAANAVVQEKAAKTTKPSKTSEI